MKYPCGVFLLFLLLSMCSCDNRREEIESLKNSNTALKSELEKLRDEQKLVLTNLSLVQELSGQQKVKIAEREEELARLRDSYTNLQTQLTQAQSDNEQTKKELAQLRDSQNQQAAQQEKAQQTQKIKVIIGKILAKLDRILQENPRYSSARLKSDLDDEENRLKSLANSQKADIGELTAELEALGFQDKRNLDSMVSDFVFKYGLYASYCRMSWSAILVRGEKDESEWNGAYVALSIGFFLCERYYRIKTNTTESLSKTEKEKPENSGYRNGPPNSDHKLS